MILSVIAIVLTFFTPSAAIGAGQSGSGRYELVTRTFKGTVSKADGDTGDYQGEMIIGDGVIIKRFWKRFWRASGTSITLFAGSLEMLTPELGKITFFDQTSAKRLRGTSRTNHFSSHDGIVEITNPDAPEEGFSEVWKWVAPVEGCSGFFEQGVF